MTSLSTHYPRKRAFITGTGSGLGKALSLELAKEGWKIGITDIHQASLEQTEKEVKALGGISFSFLFDVSSSMQYEIAVSSFLDQVGGIDLLINNAGVGEGTLFEDYSLANWNWIIGVNQVGVLHGCHFFVPVMKRQGYGNILNIASAAGFANMPQMSPYNVTKAAVISLSESLYYELKPFGVHVSVTTPTFFKSSILQHARGAESIKEKAHKVVQTSRWDATQAAKTILKQVAKKKLWIIFPFEGKILWGLKRISPFLYRKLVIRLFKQK